MTELFTQFLKSLKFTLQQAGFSQSHSHFRHCVHDNWALLNFQCSSSSTAITPHFTINLGVYSSVLATVFPSFRMRSNPALKPLEIDGHWRIRVGQLLPTPKDTWWRFTAEIFTSCIEDVQYHLTTYAIPTLQQYSSDEALRELWSTGSRLGVDSEVVRLEYLSLLANVYGTEDEVDTWLETLHQTSGKTTMQLMKRALERL
jgi:hypothetical protein